MPLLAVQWAKTQPEPGAGEYVLEPSLFDLDVYRAVWWIGAVLTLVYVLLALSTVSLSKPLDETLTLFDSQAPRGGM